MAKAKLIIEITPPVNVSGKDLKEWITFELLREGAIANKNPLFYHELSERHIKVTEYRTLED